MLGSTRFNTFTTLQCLAASGGKHVEKEFHLYTTVHVQPWQDCCWNSRTGPRRTMARSASVDIAGLEIDGLDIGRRLLVVRTKKHDQLLLTDHFYQTRAV